MPLFHLPPVLPGRKLALLTLGLVLSSACTHATSLTDQVGMLDVTDYGAIADDGIDDTAGIQAAITAGIMEDMTVFFPAGIYHISETLDAMMIGVGTCGGEAANPSRLVGFTSDDPSAPRTVLRLQDNLPAFNNPNNLSGDARLKPLLWVRLNAPNFPEPNKEDCLYHGVVRDLDFDLGSGNAFAVGVSFGSAQYSSLENVHVSATGAFAGFQAVPGANMANVNLSVDGGQYGFYLNSGSVGATLVGLTLTNQTNAGIYNRNYRGLTVVGLNFSTSSTSAAAIRTGGPSVFQGHTVLVDASIQMPVGTNQPAVQNLGPRHVSLINTYVTGPTTIVGGNTTAEQALTTGSPAAWTHVKDYACTPNIAGTHNGTTFYGKHILDGVMSPAPGTSGIAPTTIRDIAIVAAPPVNLVSRHVWSSTPSFTDADVIFLSPSGGDDTAAIQQALNTAANAAQPYTKVLLTEGTYTVSSTLQLRSGTVLMGIPGFGSIIKPSQAFIENFNSVSGSTPRGWILSTPNDAEANPVIMDLSVFSPYTTTSGLGVLHWMSGCGEVRGLKPYNGGYKESHRRMIQIDNNGGGKWYAYSDHFSLPNGSTDNSDFRKLFIGSGAGNPLTFYGLNLERGGKTSTVPQVAFCEINHASNVRIFGAKTEIDGVFLDIRNNSHNIQVVSIQPLRRDDISSSLIRIHPGALDSAASQIEIRSSQWANSGSRIIDDYFAPAAPNSAATRNHYIGVYRRGTFDSAPWESIANQAPTVRITSPVTGTSVSALDPIAVSADAADADGGVAIVEFQLNGVVAADDTSSPYAASLVVTTPGSYVLSAVATDDTFNRRVSAPVALTVLPATGFLIPTATTAPVIDGVVDSSWSAIPATAVTHLVAGSIDNPADFSATFRTQWDANYLYLLAEVSDANPHPQHKIRKDDRVELYIDANHDQLAAYGATDFQYRFNPKPHSIEVWEGIHGATSGVIAEATSSASGYVLEARLPWTTLAQSNVTLGASIGFDLVINDEDQGHQSDARLAWFNAADIAAQSPGNLSTARLAP